MVLTPELAALLRACIVWRSDRPHVDNEAIVRVAEWCDANPRPQDVDEGARIRDALGWCADGGFFVGEPRWTGNLREGRKGRERYGEDLKFGLWWRIDRDGPGKSLLHEAGEVTLRRYRNGSAKAWCSDGLAWLDVSPYRTLRDENASALHGLAQAGGLRIPAEDIDLVGVEAAKQDLFRAFANGIVYPPGALQRIFDLARWDLICRLLKCPPMRLLASGEGVR